MPRQPESGDPNGDELRESTTAITATPRFHELDALRASAMLLGIVLHAAIFLIPGASDEEYPREVSGIYTPVFFAIHGFRMLVFFLLSGFFTAMLWQRRGLRQLGKHRLKRISLPLIIGCFTILPITALIAVPDEFELIWWPFVWLDNLQHLWFLWFLLWMAGGFILAAKLGGEVQQSCDLVAGNSADSRVATAHERGNLWPGHFHRVGFQPNGARVLRPLLCVWGLFLPAKHRNSYDGGQSH